MGYRAAVSAPAPAPPEATPGQGRRARAWRDNPWWIPPFLGSVPAGIEPRLMQVFALVALGLFFEQYDFSLLSAALKHIADDLHFPNVGRYLAFERFGGFLAFGLLPLADRFGRRIVFLAAMVGMSVGTLATAFSQTPSQFIGIQLLTRASLLTCSSIGVVMLIEEFPAEHRGWGLGMLGALANIGNGLGAALFAFVDHLPFGWRSLYAVGVVPALLLPHFRRTLQETGRFRQLQAQRGATSRSFGSSLRSLGTLARTYPWRAFCVGQAGLLASLGAISVFQFASYFVQTQHGWEPWRYSTMLLTAGGVGIIGNVVAGRLGDRFGRRLIGCGAYVIYCLASVAFYHGPGWSLAPCFALIVFTISAGDVVVRAFSTELFPTSQRGASQAWMQSVQTIGAMAGLWIVGNDLAGNLAGIVSWLSIGVAAAGIFLLLLPETRQRELETLSQEA